MKIQCRQVQDAAAAGHPLNDLQCAHLAICARCAAVVSELQQLDQGLASLRQQVPQGLSDATVRLVEMEGASVESKGPLAGWVPLRLGDRMVAAGIAAGLALVTLPFISYQVFQLEATRGLRSHDEVTATVVSEEPASDLNRDIPSGTFRSDTETDHIGQTTGRAAALVDESTGTSYYRELSEHGADDVLDLDGKEANGAKRKRQNIADGRYGTRFLDMGNARNQPVPPVSATEPPARPAPAAPPLASLPAEETPVVHFQDKNSTNRDAARLGLHAQSERQARSVEGPAAQEATRSGALSKPAPGGSLPGSQPVPSTEDRLVAEGFLAGRSRRVPKGDTPQTARQPPDHSSERVEREADNEDLRDPMTRLTGAGRLSADLPGEPQDGAEVGGLVGGGRLEKREGTPSSAFGLPTLLQRFGYGVLGHEPEEWKHVTLDQPVYFENTYLGGNAKLALLDHLAGTFRLAAGEAAPHRLARLLPQHLDPPAEGGMALQVDLDRASAVRGELNRVFLQVGLVGGDNPAWRRPPLSLSTLVIASAPDALERARAALGELERGLHSQDALYSLSDLGDAGRLAASPPELQEDKIAQILGQLGESFVDGEGRGSVRNRRLVVLTDREFPASFEREVHRLGLQDVSTSVISLHTRHFASHARVAVAGSGNLHVARSAEEARRVANDELTSLTRIVARALRLNIQPAPGVKLIQVLGSRPLSRVEKQRVKETEIAVDQHVEATTGIAGDRGEDDPGLQTVIPYFYGGDEHVVIVELEVSGPGPVADVSLKYKDMVDMRNRTLRASGALSRHGVVSTDRQEMVQRNLFGFALAQVLSRLESGLRSGGSGATAGLDELRALRAPVDADAVWSAGDLLMLEQYAELLAQRPAGDTLANSLQYARLAKLGRSR